MKALDWILFETTTYWKVRIPDKYGECIGRGNTKTGALTDAIQRLEGTLPALKDELEKAIA